MYEKTDRLCPKCFRWLRANQKNRTLYCPDTLRCQLAGPIIGFGSPQRFSIETLQEVLCFEQGKTRQHQDRLRIDRIKEAIVRFG